ncbi:MAG: antibiotic biosynthesis monooxygenase [Alphaproteobacteria bacterium]|nr:antibiotic biosynthesis monooxygenase [Alphaproteobacteria bacterium]
MDNGHEYFAVIFSSKRTPGDNGYGEMTERMMELAAQQPGFIGVETARDEHLGITISYWENQEAIAAWKKDAEHHEAQRLGHKKWYQSFSLRVCKVVRESHFERR